MSNITVTEAMNMPVETLVRRLNIHKVDDRIRFCGVDSADTEIVDVIRSRKAEIIAEIDRESAEKAAKDKSEEDAEYIPYTVYSTTAYGIYNGFHDNHLAFKKILNSVLPENVRYDDDVLRDILHITRHDERIKDIAMAYYKPYPQDPCWTDEAKAIYAHDVANRTAAGECLIPRAIAENIIRETANRVLREMAPKRVEAISNSIKRLKPYVCASAAEVKARWTSYNNVHNEGGEGYVPPFCTQSEIDSLMSELIFWQSVK